MTGLLCPGQGAQFVGMGRDLADAFPEARATFQEADDALGFALSRVCWEGPESDLTLTRNAQPAILVHTIAVWRVLSASRPLRPELAAGHSLGEFSAYVAAGALGFADGVRLVRTRGELMYRSGQARPGTMAAVLGLDDTAAEEACAAASAPDSVVVPANYNSPGQIVVSGDVEAVRRLEPIARERGAKKVVPLSVSGAFHSPLMEDAVEGLREAVAAAAMTDPAFPIVSNVTARPVRSAEQARDLLVRQLTSPVRWVDSLQTMLGAGVQRFVEIGPGTVLAGLLKRVDRAALSRSLGRAEEVDAYLAEEG